MTKEEFENKCYEVYKLNWMISHGYSLRDYLNALILEDEEASNSGNYPEGDARDIFESLDSRFEYDTGFNGTIWVCKEEFLDAEFNDEEYMAVLLSQMPEANMMRDFYRTKYGKLLPEEHLDVYTSAGVLKAYKLKDPGNPGICVMLQPAAYEEEIDVTQASVYEDKDYATEGERSVDVVIHSWGDATTEDYTTKEIIRREEVIAGLGTALHA